jgi:hypothetical protein
LVKRFSCSATADEPVLFHRSKYQPEQIMGVILTNQTIGNLS